MIEITKLHIGPREPAVSLVLACTPDLGYQVDQLANYLIGIDCLGIEIVAAIVRYEEFKEAPAKNKAARQASSDYLVFTNCGVYPSASMIAKTRKELVNRPTAIVEALRLDGTRDYGVFPNPFAIGDWQAVTRSTFNTIRGYDEELFQAGGIDGDFAANAVAHGCEMVLLDERVFHAWHAPRFDDENYKNQSATNEQKTQAKGFGRVVLYYPDKAFVDFDGSASCLPLVAQSDTVLDVTPHSPRNTGYWQSISQSKSDKNSYRQPIISVDTDYPAAFDSADCTKPDAAVRENNSTRAFVSEMEALMPGKPLRLLDLGCAGGGLVADFVNNGHVAVGLEGCDQPLKRGLFNWPELGGKALFTCDISRRFTVLENDSPFKCDIVTAMDVMEHIPATRLDWLLQNIAGHLVKGGYFIASIASDNSICDGVEHHESIYPQEWWRKKIAEYLQPVDYQIKSPPRRSLWELQVFRKGGGS